MSRAKKGIADPDETPRHARGRRTINREWHALNKMPRHPTFEDRMHWHLKHAANCGCRPIPAKLLDEMALHGYGPVTPRSLK